MEHQNQDLQDQEKSYTAVFVNTVDPRRAKDFLAWSEGIHAEAEKFEGFLDVTVIQMDEDAGIRFTTLLRFDSQANLQIWSESEQSRQWLSGLSGILNEAEITAQGAGSNLWFKFQTHKEKSPPLWKETLLGTVVVYPMILLLNWLLDPLIGGLPTNTAIFIVVVVLSALLANPVMPFVNRISSSWLHKKS